MIDRRLFCASLSAAALLPAAARAQGKVVTLPIKPGPDNIPTIQLTIAGQGPFTFAIDTGAGFGVISPAVARRLKLIGTHDMVIGSLKGQNISRVYTVPEIIVGGALRIPQFEMAAPDAYDFADLDGMLPAAFLTMLPAQLDFAAQELRYYLNGAPMDLDGFREIRSVFHADNPNEMLKVYVEVQLAGEKLLCCLDTGASLALIVSSESVAKHKWWDAFPAARESSSYGVNGEPLKTRTFAAQDVTVGGLPLRQIPVTLDDPGDRQSRSMTYDGLVGITFLQHFTLAFDPRRVLYFKPNRQV